MTMLSRVSKPNNFESHNSLRHNSTNIGSLHFRFVGYDSFIESSSPDTLLLFETSLYGSINSNNISVRGSLPLVQKDSVTHMHDFAVYVKEGLPFTWDLSLENSEDSYLCFQQPLLYSVSFFFFLY